MLKFLSLLIAAILFAAPAYAKKKKVPVLQENRAYVFYLKMCPICREALAYLDDKYPSRPDVIRVDMETEEGRELLKQCAKKFNVKSIVAPMVCIGNRQFMGWSTKAARDFDAYMEELYTY